MRVRIAASTLLLAVAIFANRVTAAQPRVELRLEADGSVDLAGEHIVDHAKIVSSLKALLAQNKVPKIVIQTGKNVRFEKIGELIKLMQEAGVPKIGFIIEPQK